MVATKTAGTWRYEDLFALPDDGRRYEIVEGELHELPAPGLDHGIAVTNLIPLFWPVVTALGARLLIAPVDVFFPGADPVQPDLLLLMPDRLALMSKRGIEGAPSLVVEAVSPSNPSWDRVRKRALYERAGVLEYWLVDPVALAIEVLTLDGGHYRPHVRATGDEEISSPLLPVLSFPASAAFVRVPTR